MPLTKVKPSKSQRVREKSEIDDLFFRLMTLYHPGPLPPLSLPIFQGAEVPVLLFPTLQVAQARVWRNLEGPSSEELKSVIDLVSFRGLDREQVGFLIGLCEALFRPLRAVEVALEKLFPDFLYSRCTTWPPSAVACDLLARDFRQRWKEEEKIFGKEWVLAAGHTPIPLKHRPAPIAPWVVGVVLKRWLVSLTTEPEEATTLAIGAASVLLNRPIRVEELHHWEGILDKILVTTDHGKALLPGYLMNPMTRLRAPFSASQFEQLTPGRFLEFFPIDNDACAHFAHILGQAWTPPEQKRPKPVPPQLPREARRISEAAAPPIADRSPESSDEEGSAEEDSAEEIQCRPCGLCNHYVPVSDIYRHLEEAHSISREDVESFPNRKELRSRKTKKLLYRWEGD